MEYQHSVEVLVPNRQRKSAAGDITLRGTRALKNGISHGLAGLDAKSYARAAWLLIITHEESFRPWHTDYRRQSRCRPGRQLAASRGLTLTDGGRGGTRYVFRHYCGGFASTPEA
jgi:hypothetical protein